MGYDGYGEFELTILRCWQLRRQSVLLHVASRQQHLIAALAIKGPSPRSYIAGLLWPDFPDARALESLRVSLHLVSRHLPGLVIKDGELLALHSGVDVDLHRIRSQIQTLRNYAPAGYDSTFVRKWRGAELLPGWYEDWVVFEQGRLSHECLYAFTTMSQNLLAFNDFEAASEAAEAALQIEPLFEPAVSALVMAGVQGGNPVLALRAYEHYRTLLEEDMGLLPSEPLRRLVTRTLGRYALVRSGHLDSACDARPSRQPISNH